MPKKSDFNRRQIREATKSLSRSEQLKQDFADYYEHEKKVRAKAKAKRKRAKAARKRNR